MITEKSVPVLKSKEIKKSHKPNPLKVSSKNIDTFKTRKLHTIIDDLAHFTGADKRVSAKILLARGVARLFKQKSSLGKFSLGLKDQNKNLHQLLSMLPRPSKKRVRENLDLKNYYLTLGELNTIIKLRKALSNIIDKKGMQIPDDDQFKRLLQVKYTDLIKEIK